MSATLPQPPLDEFTEAYVRAALWSTTGDDGEPLDDQHSAQDISAETMAKIVADCARFQKDNASLITEDNFLVMGNYVNENAGHDFWLTRNGHGAGFWDGDWDGDWTKEAGEKLTKASKAFGEFNLYVGDDGKIYG